MYKQETNDIKIKEGLIKGVHYSKSGEIIKQFSPNKLWGIMKAKFNVDIRIPFLTGRYVDKLVLSNNITDIGLSTAIVAFGDMIISAGMGIGTPATNALGNEVIRGNMTKSPITTIKTNDTISCMVTFIFDAEYELTEAGLFDESYGGNMLAVKTYPGVNVLNGELYELTWEIRAE